MKVGVSLLLLSAAAMASSGASPKQATALERQSLVQHLRWMNRSLPPQAPREHVRYAYALIDLNGDGVKEALAYVTGWQCGTGGCGLDILERRGAGWRSVGATDLGFPPIRVLKCRSHGWRDLALRSRFDSRESHTIRLRFDGKHYPNNSEERLASGEEGKILISGATLPLFQ